MEKLAQWLQEAKSVVVFTGAGMSTESGLPDFRSQTGLWRGEVILPPWMDGRIG